MRGAALLTCALAAVAFAPAAGGVSSDPRLAVFAGDPVAVRGRQFKPGERVTVRFASGSDLRARSLRWHTQSVVADELGTFVVRFRGVRLTRCTSYSVRASGVRGSRAFFERTVRCEPGTAPRR